MSRIFCFIFGHKPIHGVSPAQCIVYHCTRCHALAHGRYGVAR